MTRRAIIIDTETTGLDAARDEIWEIGVILRSSGSEHLWRMKPDLAKADPAALAVGQFYDRTAGMCERCRPGRAHDLASPAAGKADREWSSPEQLAAVLAPVLAGVTVIAANPTFDAGFLAAFLRRNGHAPTWHYRLRDIGSMAYGFLCGRSEQVPPIDASTDVFAEALGVDPGQFERHSALGDCRLVAAMLDVIERGVL